MKIDAHVHIFPPEICRQREKFFRREPDFELLYASPKAKLVGAEALLETMDEEGVDYSVVFGFPWRDDGVSRLCNDYVIEQVGNSPGRLRGLACFGFTDPEAAARESERCIDAGLSGIGELAFYVEGFTAGVVERFAPVIDVLRSRKKLLMLHTNEPVGHQYPGKSEVSFVQLYRFLKLYGDVPTIFAHWGGGFPFFHLLKKEVGEVVANLYYDTAASPYLFDNRIYRLGGEMIGFDKVLFGSDYPLLRPGRYFREIAEAGLTEDEAALVCGINAARLFEIDDRK
ncbi:MAG: amidohydrolase family protein [Deltaproteobacteria bacterium]|nr:amidohydrolase family protein [Deltaproteobacteria bacterium]